MRSIGSGKQSTIFVTPDHVGRSAKFASLHAILSKLVTNWQAVQVRSGAASIAIKASRYLRRGYLAFEDHIVHISLSNW